MVHFGNEWDEIMAGEFDLPCYPPTCTALREVLAVSPDLRSAPYICSGVTAEWDSPSGRKSRDRVPARHRGRGPVRVSQPAHRCTEYSAVH